MIDKRRHYVLVVDTETANTLTETVPAEIGEDEEIITPERVRMDMSNVLVYDCGWAVVDTKGNIYETASFVNRDIFNDERDLMRTAYYNWKIPRYVEELRAGTRKMATTYEIRHGVIWRPLIISRMLCGSAFKVICRTNLENIAPLFVDIMSDI